AIAQCLPWQRVDLRAHAHDDETSTGFRFEKVGQLRRQVGQGLKEVVANARDGPGLPPRSRSRFSVLVRMVRTVSRQRSSPIGLLNRLHGTTLPPTSTIASYSRSRSSDICSIAEYVRRTIAVSRGSLIFKPRVPVPNSDK